MKEPVDAVITWVDGNDKAHADKLAAYLARMSISRPDSAAPTRYNQCGELNYCVSALLQFAPWIRTIYIITDAQAPAIMQKLAGTDAEKKIKLIDHREIFADLEHHLPTFNSLTIETLLWRIPGLANKFIYFNDDCIIIRPVAYDDFFRDDKLVFRGFWKIRNELKLSNRFKKWLRYVLMLPAKQTILPPHRVFQEKGAQLAGFPTHFFDLPHVPFPLHKEIFAEFFQRYPDILAENVKYALRDQKQFWPISLAMHLEIKAKKAIYDNSLQGVMVNGGHHALNKIQSRLEWADKKHNVVFICMQSLDLAPVATQKFMLEWLNKRINVI